MKEFKKVISVILCIVMVFGSAPLAGFVGLELPSMGDVFFIKSEAAKYEGTFGENFEWSLDSSYGRVLYISGTGDMENWLSDDGAPWDYKEEYIEHVVIRNGVTSIGDYAFSGCSNLMSVTIPESITSVGESAFSDCDSLERVDFLGDVAGWSRIGFDNHTSNPIYYADNLYINGVTLEGDIIIPDGITNIGNYAFYTCDSITSITIPDGVTSIGCSAFSSCDNLISVTIPDSVTSIGDNAFYSCDSITSITIPDSVTSIGYRVFRDCKNLEKITVDSENILYTSDENGVLFDKDKKTLIQYPLGNTRQRYEIPDSVTSIGDYSFTSCDNLISVTIPDSVTSIGAYAFAFCYNLTSVTIPDRITSIGDSAFYSCDNLIAAYYPGTREQWENVSHGKDYNYLKSCLVFESNSERPYYNEGTCGENLSWFLGVDRELIINGSGAMSNFDSSSPWNIYDDIIKNVTIFDGVTSIGDYSFTSCDNLISVTIPDSVTSIGESAFSDCDNITNVTIGNGVISIGNKAFSDCDSLTNVTIGNSVTIIRYSAFSSCDNLAMVMLPNSIIAILDYAFMNCNNLTKVYYKGSEEQWKNVSVGSDNTVLTDYLIFFSGTEKSYYSKGTCGDNLNWILCADGELIISGTGEMTDYNYSNSIPWYNKRKFIESVKLENGITSIGKYAFSDCDNLAEVSIGNSVTSIGERAFNDCDNLTSVTIPKDVTIIAEGAFYDCSNLESINVDSENTVYSSDEYGVLFNKDKTTLVQYPMGNARTTYLIPDSVKNIGAYAFYYCSSLLFAHYLGKENEVDVDKYAIENKSVSIHYCTSISDATCLNSGIGYWSCEVCDEIIVSNVVFPALGHDWSNKNGVCARENCGYECEHPEDKLNWEISVVPTCLPGEEVATCSICGLGENIEIVCDKSTYPESAHNYTANMNKTWEFSYEGATKLVLKFTNLTETESNYDFIYIYDSNGIQFGKYSGTQLSGAIIELDGSSFKIKFTSDHSVFKYGFSFESITAIAINEKIDPDLKREIPAAYEHDWSDKNGVCGNGCGTECSHPSYTQAVCDICGGNCETLGHVFNPEIGGCSVCGHKCETMGHIFNSADGGCLVCAITGGICGENLEWILNADGELEITGTGNMTDWSSYSSVPWYKHCSSIKSVIISDDATSIGDYAFYGCSGITNILIPSSITSISSNAFYNCSGLSVTYYPGTMTEWQGITIGSNNAYLTKYVVYEYGTDNANYGSGSCGNSLTWILYQNGDLVIEGSGAIPNYSESSVPWYSVREKIRNVYIPEGVTNIGASAFIGCDNVEKFVVEENNIGFVADEYGVLYNSNKTKLVKYPSKSVYTEYTIPESVVSIRPKAFEEAKNLTSVTLNTGITEIGDSAFIGCSNLVAANYYGTQENWNTITVGANNESLTNSLVFEYGTENFNYGKGTCGTNLTWVLYGNGSLVISGTGSMDDYSAGSAPWSNLSSKIVLIKISDGVTTIGNSAFAFCSSAETVEIPSSITTIGDAAFAECDKLKTASVPYGVKTVGADAFRDCDLLESVVLADSVTTLGDSAFYMCDSLKTVTLSNKIQKIDDYTFYKCISLESLVIPDSVTYIGYYAFYYCGQLKELTMPVTARIYNSYYVFSGCTEIDKITLTKGTTGVMLNYGTSTSSSSTITNYEYTPWYISGCPEVVIADGVKSIGECAFYDCGKLKKLTLPGSLDSMGYMSFYYMSGLSDIYFTGTLADWCEITIDNVHVVNHAENLYINGKLVEGDLVIPDGVTYVGDKAFFNVDSITSVTIPNSINQIGTYAFASCDGITNVKIGNGVTIIEDYAFVECPAITTLVIGNNVANIGNGAFMSCVELRELTMPVTAKIYNSEDTFYGCKKLEKVTLTKGTTGIMQDYGTSTSETSTITNYKYTPWYISDSCKEIIIEDSITNIGNYAFRGCHQCISVIIPDSVTKIGTYAFYECYNIKTLKIPDAVTTIGNSAFYNCTGLKELTMPISANIYNSGDTFGYCNNIEKIIFTKGTGSMPDYGTSELANSSTTNYKYTPWYISGCSKIVLPSGISTIGEYAFHECSNLTTVNFDGTIDDYYDIYIKDYNDPLFNARTNFGSYKITWIFGETTEQETFFAGEEIITPDYECEKGYSIVWSPEVPEIMPAQNLAFTAFFEKINYKVEWNIEGVISEETYTYGQILNVPSVPSKLGYEFVGWTPTVPETMPDYELSFTAVFEPISYTATFIAEGVVVSTQTFTVETEKLVEPDVPQKAGYFACWDYYELKCEDIIISAKYYLPDAVMISKHTLYVGDTYRLLPSCNFEVTNKVWKSNDTSVATVNQNGKISAVGEGNCKITVVCYGKDSLGNDVKATESTEIVVKEQPKKTDVKQTFREMFDEFFEVTLHDLLFNLREFLIVLFRYAY